MGLEKEGNFVPWTKVVSYRSIAPETSVGRESFDRFIAELGEKLQDRSVDRNALCREVLFEIYYGRPASEYQEVLEGPGLGAAQRAALLSLDPRNVALEPEFYQEVDIEKYYARKPLIWLWIMFDRSPLGMNCHLGFRLRHLLARHIFKRCGENVKIFQNVEFTFGYNLSVGNNVTIHRHVFIDDRGEVIIHDNASLSDYVNIYSHSHSIYDIREVSVGRTEIGPRARLTYHSTVLSGVSVGENGMLGAAGLATRDIPPDSVSVGIPAKVAKDKKREPEGRS